MQEEFRTAIGAQKFMRKSRGPFVFWQSARGLAHSKTLRVFQESSCHAQRLELRRPSAAFPGGISNCADVNWNCYRIQNEPRAGCYDFYTPPNRRLRRPYSSSAAK